MGGDDNFSKEAIHYASTDTVMTRKSGLKILKQKKRT